MRINARLDDSAADKIEYLRQATGLSLSDVVREAGERYHAQVKAELERGRDALDALVGAFDGRADTPTDLAANASRYLWRDGKAADPATSPGE